MPIEVVVQQNRNQNLLPTLPNPFVDLTANPNLRFVMARPKEHGANPVILVVSSDENMTAVFEMTLNSLIDAVAEMVPAAEKWGWKGRTHTETDEELYSRIMNAVKKELGL